MNLELGMLPYSFEVMHSSQVDMRNESPGSIHMGIRAWGKPLLSQKQQASLTAEHVASTADPAVGQ